MANINWEPQKMATGISEVDTQHQEWIRRYNEFNDAIQQGKGIESVQGTLDFFIDYADIHFELEEAAMAERNCPAEKANLLAHQHMRNILIGFKSYSQKYGYSISEIMGLRIQMEEWLVEHILTIDIQLRES